MTRSFVTPAAAISLSTISPASRRQSRSDWADAMHGKQIKHANSANDHFVCAFMMRRRGIEMAWANEMHE
jgi:hypothetical protein